MSDLVKRIDEALAIAHEEGECDHRISVLTDARATARRYEALRNIAFMTYREAQAVEAKLNNTFADQPQTTAAFDAWADRIIEVMNDTYVPHADATEEALRIFTRRFSMLMSEADELGLVVTSETSPIPGKLAMGSYTVNWCIRPRMVKV